MDKIINSQDKRTSESEENNLNENGNESLKEETRINKISETTLIQDLLKATGLSFLSSKQKGKLEKKEHIDEINEQIPIDYEEEQSNYLPNQEDNDAGIQLDNPSNARVKKIFRPRRIILSIVFIVVALLVYYVVLLLLEPTPPSENVVATYNNKNITTEQLMEFIQLEGVKDNEHGICEKHGFDHSKCDKSEECEIHPVHSLESYQQIVKMIAVEKIINDWANENKIIQRDDVEHGLKDLIKDNNVESLMGQIHQKELSPRFNT